MSPRRALTPGVLVALLAFAVYLPSLWPGEFLCYDDDYLVSASTAVREGRVGQMLDPRASREDLGSEYLPVRDLSSALDARLWGERTDHGLDLTTRRAAVGFRLTNLLLYAAACALACVFVRELTGDALLAFLAAAFFAVHPVHAESAAWVSGRKDVLSGALGLAALAVFLRARRAGGARAGLGHAASVGLGLLAMLSKSTLAALPLLVGLVEVAGPALRRERARISGFSPKNEVRESALRRALVVLPHFLVAGAVVWNALGVGDRSGITRERPEGGLATIITTDLPIVTRYLAASFAPWDLRVSYGQFPLRSELSDPVVLRSGLALAAVAALVLAAAWRRPRLIAFAAAWALLGLAPVLNFVPFTQLIADRYLFLPLLGPCLVIAWALVRARRSRATPRVGALLLAGLAALGVSRGLDFATSEALFRSNLALEPGNALAHHELGRALLARAQKARSRGEALARSLAARAAAEEETAIALYHRPGTIRAGHLLEARHFLALALEISGERAAAARVEREALEEQAGASGDGPPAAREEARRRLAAFAARLLAAAREPWDLALALESARASAAAREPVQVRAALERARSLDAPGLERALEADPALRALASSP